MRNRTFIILHDLAAKKSGIWNTAEISATGPQAVILFGRQCPPDIWVQYTQG